MIFTPAADFNGPASFSYTLRDNGTTNGAADFKSSTAVASFTITEVNDVPSGVDDPLQSVAEDSGRERSPLPRFWATIPRGRPTRAGKR